ncbi:trehalose-phosphatase [Parerythrobacter jejuensis]|uniref:Trehalose 6-phosphate phosphatase n=1 Tax=Parerythrobacter jejuensis TaxID=795812 RepID=A0A845ARS6_9SPHN|nr:trehalose-phosphatase [Parerythrobacter jejuensis]MXP32087.1 trehalose-phosphatase [Parerythrobacter jejuensis]
MLQRSTLPAPTPLLGIERPALFLDFDGTLVDIASNPDAISVADDLGQKLESLSRRLEGRLAVVTGRGIDNLEQFLGSRAMFRAGSHGAHVLTAEGAVLRQAQALPDEVTARLSSFARDHNLLYERKAHGGALHYRTKPELEEQVRGFANDLAQAHDLSAKSGKCVVELVWPGADKGGAVHLLMQQAEFSSCTPIFVGDDVTDDDGMAAAVEHGGFGIAVGERPSNNASYHLDTVKDVHTWLNL